MNADYPEKLVHMHRLKGVDLIATAACVVEPNAIDAGALDQKLVVLKLVDRMAWCQKIKTTCQVFWPNKRRWRHDT